MDEIKFSDEMLDKIFHGHKRMTRRKFYEEDITIPKFVIGSIVRIYNTNQYIYIGEVWAEPIKQINSSWENYYLEGLETKDKSDVQLEKEFEKLWNSFLKEDESYFKYVNNPTVWVIRFSLVR